MTKSGRIRIFAFSLFIFVNTFVYADNRRLFEIARKTLLDKTSQSPLKKQLSRHVIKDGQNFLLLELYFPEFAGEIQSSVFYDAFSDSAKWVEDLLVYAEEERIAGELDEMENDLKEYSLNEETEEVTGGDGKSLVNKNSELEVYQFENEILMRQKTADGLSIINSSGSKVTRNFYDEKMRITARERWNIADVEKASLQEKESFVYDADSYRVVKKIISTDSQTEEIKYNQKALVESVVRYVNINDKKYVTLERICSYNDEGKILSDETIEYYYKDDYKKLNSRFSKKYIYEYNSEGIPPDFKYFENNIIKMHNKYSDIKGTYTSHVFFEGNFSVKSYFENDVRVREVYYNGNNVTREKVYERSEKQ